MGEKTKQERAPGGVASRVESILDGVGRAGLLEEDTLSKDLKGARDAAMSAA